MSESTVEKAIEPFTKQMERVYKLNRESRLLLYSIERKIERIMKEKGIENQKELVRLHKLKNSITIQNYHPIEAKAAVKSWDSELLKMYSQAISLRKYPRKFDDVARAKTALDKLLKSISACEKIGFIEARKVDEVLTTMEMNENSLTNKIGKGSTMQNSVVQQLDKAESDFTKLHKRAKAFIGKIASDKELKTALDNRYTGSLKSISDLKSQVNKRSFSAVGGALTGMQVAARKMEPLLRRGEPLAGVPLKSETATHGRVQKVEQEAKALSSELYRIQTQYSKALAEANKPKTKAGEDPLLALFDADYAVPKKRKDYIENKNSKGNTMISNVTDSDFQKVLGQLSKAKNALEQMGISAKSVDATMKTSIDSKKKALEKNISKVMSEAKKAQKTWIKAIDDADLDSWEKKVVNSKLENVIQLPDGSGLYTKAEVAKMKSEVESWSKKSIQQLDQARKAIIKADTTITNFDERLGTHSLRAEEAITKQKKEVQQTAKKLLASWDKAQVENSKEESNVIQFRATAY